MELLGIWSVLTKIGAMVIPSTWPALHDPEAYPDPDNFIPERWLEGGSAAQSMKNFLVFGFGPHYCLGQAVRFVRHTPLWLMS